VTLIIVVAACGDGMGDEPSPCATTIAGRFFPIPGPTRPKAFSLQDLPADRESARRKHGRPDCRGV